jgi:hypothetical protein
LQEREAIIKENNDHAFAMRKEQEKTRDAQMVNKQLEGNIKDLNSKMQRMEDAKEVVSNANILTIKDPSPSER